MLIGQSAAVHPGYGFLSENAEFAVLCRKNGIAFIGPSAENMEQLSNKTEVKRRMAEPVCPVFPEHRP